MPPVEIAAEADVVDAGDAADLRAAVCDSTTLWRPLELQAAAIKGTGGLAREKQQKQSPDRCFPLAV